MSITQGTLNGVKKITIEIFTVRFSYLFLKLNLMIWCRVNKKNKAIFFLKTKPFVKLIQTPISFDLISCAFMNLFFLRNRKTNPCWVSLKWNQEISIFSTTNININTKNFNSSLHLTSLNSLKFNINSQQKRN